MSGLALALGEGIDTRKQRDDENQKNLDERDRKLQVQAHESERQHAETMRRLADDR